MLWIYILLRIMLVFCPFFMQQQSTPHNISGEALTDQTISPGIICGGTGSGTTS